MRKGKGSSSRIGKSNEPRISDKERGLHAASSWIAAAASELQDGLMQFRYEDPKKKWKWDGSWEMEDINEDLERAIKSGDGDAGFMAMGTMWLSILKTANKLWSPRLAEAERKRHERREKYLATPAGQAATKKRLDRAQKKREARWEAIDAKQVVREAATSKEMKAA